MGDRTTDELIELACQRLDGMYSRLERIGSGPVWMTLWHEYADLYNEVYTEDLARLRTRFGE